MEITTVLWREFLFFKRRIVKITASAIMTPILYLIAFGWGLGKNFEVEGASYMHFLIPGIIAMTTMNTGFNAVSSRLVTARLFDKSFEYYLTSPVNLSLVSLGYITSGVLRGLYATGLIVLVSLLFGVKLNIDFYFVVICFLNSFVFSALGYIAALSVESHYDIGNFNTYIMTPMSFLCGTFFSLENLPDFVRWLIGVLPLTHASISLRNIVLRGAFLKSSIVVLIIYSVVLYAICIKINHKDM